MQSELLNHPLISERYFFPRRDAVAAPFWIDCGDARLACHYTEVDPEGFTVVHFHGNGEVAADYVDILPQFFAELGANCLLAEFRGYGASTGRAELGRILDDALTVIEALPQPAEKLILFGRSVGSLPAIHAIGHTPQVAGLIIESGVADALERLLLRVTPAELGVSDADLRAVVGRDLDQQAKLAGYAGPLLVMHTRFDGLVDVSHGERIHAWAGSGSKRLRIFEDGDHNTILWANADAYAAEVARFVMELRGTDG